MCTPWQILLLLAIGLTACGANDSQDPTPDERLPELRTRYGAALAEAETLRDPVNRWLTPNDCDGMLWTGKYAASTGVLGVDISAAEVIVMDGDDPIRTGRFIRRPPPECASENPDWSSWSRDMGMGLLAYAWRKADITLLERHAAYGALHGWHMGVPDGDLRGVYAPAFIGRLYQTIFALGGADDVNRLWPDIYPSGLTDYQAHLQVMNIWLRGEVSDVLAGNDPKPSPDPIEDDAGGSGGPAPQVALLSIADVMLARLSEHAARDPHDPFFAAVLGRYTGDMGPAITVLLDPAMPVGEYVRCDEYRRCQLAAWIFAADIVLRRYPE